MQFREAPLKAPGKRGRKKSATSDIPKKFFLTPPYSKHGKQLHGDFTDDDDIDIADDLTNFTYTL